MRVVSKLLFLEAKTKQKFDGSGSYKMVVFYDSNSETLVKPFVESGLFEQIQLVKPFESVELELDIYNGKNGMACKLNKVISSQK